MMGPGVVRAILNFLFKEMGGALKPPHPGFFIQNIAMMKDTDRYANGFFNANDMIMDSALVSESPVISEHPNGVVGGYGGAAIVYAFQHNGNRIDILFRSKNGIPEYMTASRK